MEKQRTLTKAVNLAKLHSEFTVQSPSFKGLCASTGVVGDTLRIIDADNLTDAQVDNIIAAHVLPTTDEVATTLALSEQAQKAIKTTVVWILKRLLARNPTLAEIQAARDEWVAVWKILP